MPYFPDLRLITVGWEARLPGTGLQASGAVGRIAIADVHTMATVLRVQLAPQRGLASFLAFGQFMHVPQFRGGVLQSLGVGLGALVRIG
ncbi:MAG TPA: hypothetical protein VF981_13065 [Gemmatimonadaceae bacterium]